MATRPDAPSAPRFEDWVGNPLLEPSRNTGIDASLSLRHRGLYLATNLFLNSVNNYITVYSQVRTQAVPGKKAGTPMAQELVRIGRTRPVSNATVNRELQFLGQA